MYIKFYLHFMISEIPIHLYVILRIQIIPRSDFRTWIQYMSDFTWNLPVIRARPLSGGHPGRSSVKYFFYPCNTLTTLSQMANVWSDLSSSFFFFWSTNLLNFHLKRDSITARKRLMIYQHILFTMKCRLLAD